MIKPEAIENQINTNATIALARDRYQYAFGSAPSNDVLKPGSQFGRTMAAANAPMITARNINTTACSDIAGGSVSSSWLGEVLTDMIYLHKNSAMRELYRTRLSSSTINAAKSGRASIHFSPASLPEINMTFAATSA